MLISGRTKGCVFIMYVGWQPPLRFDMVCFIRTALNDMSMAQCCRYFEVQISGIPADRTAALCVGT